MSKENENFEIDTANYLKEKKFDIRQPREEDLMTTQEKINNRNLQLDILQKNLKSIMSPEEVSLFISRMKDSTWWTFINTHWEEIIKMLGGRKNITAVFFHNFCSYLIEVISVRAHTLDAQTFLM